MESTLQYVTVDLKETKEMTQRDWFGSLRSHSSCFHELKNCAKPPKKGKGKPVMETAKPEETSQTHYTFKPLLCFAQILVLSLLFC